MIDNKLNYLDDIDRVFFKKHLSLSYKRTSPLHYRVMSKIVLQPNGDIVEDDFWGGGNYIYLGCMFPIWGHCITDNLKKIYFLYTDEGKRYIREGYKLVCTLMNNNEFNIHFRTLLSYLDIDADDILVIKNSLKVKNLIIPDDCIVVEDKYRYYFSQYEMLINKICEKIPIDHSSPSKIYLSRTRLKGGKREFGENEIENVFRRLGYTIIYPETISLEQQLRLYWNCKEMASTEGSIAHNCLFTQKGTKHIIVKKSVLQNSYQFMMIDMKKINITYIDAHLTIFRIFASWSGPFFMYISDNFVKWTNSQGLKIQTSFNKLLFIKYSLTCFWLFIRYRLRPRIVANPFRSFYLTKLKSVFFQ